MRARSHSDDETTHVVSDDEIASTSEATEQRITRAEALRRMDAKIARRPTLSVFLNVLKTTSTAAQIPPARCVWHNKLWKYATRKWSLPELLAALKAVEGAGFHEVVRLSGERQNIQTTIGLFREGKALGWCDGDGGGSIAAMAWTHDGLRQGAQADLLWRELHLLAERGEIDIPAVRKAGGVKDWDLRKKNGKVNGKSNGKASGKPRDSSSYSNHVQRVEVFYLEIASKARKRPRAACAAYVRLRDGDLVDRVVLSDEDFSEDFSEKREENNNRWPGVARGELRTKLPKRVYTAACRAASGARDSAFAKQVALDMATDGATYDSYTAASLTSLIGASGTQKDSDAAIKVFDAARDNGVNLGGAAWSCAVGALCRAGRLDEATELLRSMKNEPFMMLWPSCPTCGETDVSENSENDETDSTDSFERWTVDSKKARVAESERRACAPAYTQVVHALCDADRAGDALRVHDEMTSAGLYAPSNPPHYRALFKALCRAGGPDGSVMTPRKAAAAAVVDAVRAATAASKAHNSLKLREEGEDEEGDDDTSTPNTTSSTSTNRDAASSPSRGMAAAMSLEQSKFAGEAIRCTLQIAAEAGFPDVSSEARARLRWARVDPAPTDLELTLEAYSRAGDARGAVAHWNANRRALLAEAGSNMSGSTDDTNTNTNTPTSWEVGADGVVVLGCEPTRRAWTAIIKAHCDLDESNEAAAMLREAVESEARRNVKGNGRTGGLGGLDTTHRRQATNTNSTSKVPHHVKPSDANKLRGVERVAFNVVAACYSRARAPRRAEDLLWLMDAAGVQPDEVTYNTVIGAYAAAARPPPSGGVERFKMRRLGIQNSSTAFVSDGAPIGTGDSFNSTGFDDMIELALDTDVRFTVNNNSFGSTAPDEDFTAPDELSEESPVDAVFRLTREMRSKRVGLSPSLRTWTAVLTACARAGDADRASEAFAMMHAMDITPDRRAWTALIKSHASNGDTKGAAEAYWKMRAEGVVPDEATLSAALAAGPTRDGTHLDAAAAMALYRDARALDVRPNNEGFRRLTGMWVDQAFDIEETSNGGEHEKTKNNFSPDFMLASLLDDDGEENKDLNSTTDGYDQISPRRPLVDVHGLSTVETRAAVLSVLQALRERRRSKLPVSGDLVIVTGTGQKNENTNGESSLRDAVFGLAKDLGLEITEVSRNQGRLVVKEPALLTWLDRRRGEEVVEEGLERQSEDSVTSSSPSMPTTPTPRRRKYTRRAMKPKQDVPGLEGALKEWLRENDDVKDDLK